MHSCRHRHLLWQKQLGRHLKACDMVGNNTSGWWHQANAEACSMTTGGTAMYPKYEGGSESTGQDGAHQTVVRFAVVTRCHSTPGLVMSCRIGRGGHSLANVRLLLDRSVVSPPWTDSVSCTGCAADRCQGLPRSFWVHCGQAEPIKSMHQAEVESACFLC